MEVLEHPDGPRFPYTALTGEYICCKYVEDVEFGPSPWARGSHYHCPRCWESTGMYGHTSSLCRKLTGSLVQRSTDFHRCCPDGYCELEEEKSRDGQ